MPSLYNTQYKFILVNENWHGLTGRVSMSLRLTLIQTLIVWVVPLHSKKVRCKYKQNIS